MWESALNEINYNSRSRNRDAEGEEHGNVDNHIGLNKKCIAHLTIGLQRNGRSR